MKRQGEEALEANARRVAALLDRVEVLQAERNELAAKLQGAEAQLAGSGRRPSGEPMAEMKAGTSFFRAFEEFSVVFRGLWRVCWLLLVGFLIVLMVLVAVVDLVLRLLDSRRDLGKILCRSG